VVGIGTRYGLDGPEFEPRWGRFLQTRPLGPWGPSSLLYNGYWGSLPGVHWTGRDDHTPFSTAEVENWYSYTSTIPLTALVCYGVSFTFHPTKSRSGVEVKFASVHLDSSAMVW
jgi:hypothetical protein